MEENRIIRVLVVASSPMTRAGLEALVRADERLVIVGDERSGETLTGVRAHRPDVLLIESEARRSRDTREMPPIVLLCDGLNRAELRRELHSGVRAVLPRDADRHEIAAAIAAVAAGLMVLSAEDMDALLPGAAEDDTTLHSEPLTAREAEVLNMLAEGAANRDIASRLGISEHTVKFHVSSVLAKLGASSRAEAVARGMRDGLIVI